MTKEQLLKAVNYGKMRGAQSVLAKKIKLSTASVANWFIGKTYPTEENIKRIANAYNLDINEVRKAFYPYEEIETPENNEKFLREIEFTPLTPKNTVSLPILADIPAGLPDYSDKDVEIFKDIPRDMFPGADFVIRCIGDSLSPKFDIGDFCVVRKTEEPMHGRAMLVETETGYCMKVINKTAKGTQLCSINKKYKPFYPKKCRIIGLIIGLWTRTDKENLLEIV